MKLIVSNTITVKEPTPDVRLWCKKELTLPNPEYAKKVRMGFWLGDTPKTINLYEQRGTDLVIPFGTLTNIPGVSTALIESAFHKAVTVDFKGHDVPLYDYQALAVEKLFKAKYGILQSAAGSGKGLPYKAKVYTPFGFSRIGDLQVGDEVCNSYGTTSKVTGVFPQGKQFCYKIEFTDGCEIVTDKNHLWECTNDVNGKKSVLSTEEIYKSGWTNNSGRLLYKIPITKPVSFNTRPVSIDPWLLGALLGDGGFTRDSISFSNTEQDIIHKVNDRLSGKLVPKNRVDFNISDNGSIKYRLIDCDLFGKHSHEKFIPDDYIYNNISTRLNVLRGLIDTDGEVRGTSYIISSTSKQLVDDCLTIVQSLGGTGKISNRITHYTYNGEKREGKQSYRLYFKLYNHLPFTSVKHSLAHKPRVKYTTGCRKIKNISITAPQNTVCISVDSDNELFITDNFIVTHNTQIGIALIKKFGKRALWLTHTVDLLNQSKARAEQYIDKSLIGTITEGKVNIGSGITFATIQTMCKLDLTQLKHHWDLIVVDECHRVAGTPTAMTQFYKVLNNLAARNKIGLSATVHRSDGMINATYALLGKIAYTVPDSAVGDKIMKVGIMPISTGIELSRECLNTDGTLNYARLINYLSDNGNRCELITGLLAREENKSCLILSDRLSHLETMMSLLPASMRKQAVMVSGKMTTKKGKADREKAIADMRTGKKKYLFATYSLAKEGLDIPRLERLFLTTPQKDYAVITQSIGRIARIHEGKDKPIVYDFVDNIDYLARSYKKRCTTYRKNGCYFVEGG